VDSFATEHFAKLSQPIFIQASTAIPRAILTTSYFHRPEELAAEANEAGFSDVRDLAVEGPAWSASQFRDAWSDPVQRERLMEFLSLIESEPSI